MILSALFIATLPAYFRPLPWTCKDGAPSVTNGFQIDVLAECHPKDKDGLKAWVQRVADAMGYAGLAPGLKMGPLGPHLFGMDHGALVSATFVKHDGGRFDIWVSKQRPGNNAAGLPELPAGATLVSDHSQEGQRLVQVHLDAPVREASALLDSTLQAIGAKALGRSETETGSKAGRLLLAGKTGHYTLEPSDKGSYLNLFVGGERAR